MSDAEGTVADLGTLMLELRGLTPQPERRNPGVVEARREPAPDPVVMQRLQRAGLNAVINSGVRLGFQMGSMSPAVRSPYRIHTLRTLVRQHNQSRTQAGMKQRGRTIRFEDDVDLDDGVDSDVLLMRRQQEQDHRQMVQQMRQTRQERRRMVQQRLRELTQQRRQQEQHQQEIQRLRELQQQRQEQQQQHRRQQHRQLELQQARIRRSGRDCCSIQ